MQSQLLLSRKYRNYAYRSVLIVGIIKMLLTNSYSSTSRWMWFTLLKSNPIGRPCMKRIEYLTLQTLSIQSLIKLIFKIMDFSLWITKVIQYLLRTIPLEWQAGSKLFKWRNLMNRSMIWIRRALLLLRISYFQRSRINIQIHIL